MLVLEFLFVVTTSFIAASCFGYFVFVRFLALISRRPAPRYYAELPTMSVVIPCYNEGEGILEKLANLRALTYPRELLEAVFVDGGSTDDTVARLTAAVHEPWIRIVRSPLPGKIQQLNCVLPELCGDIIVNTDADGGLDPAALMAMAAEFAAAPDIGVVGAYCRPGAGIELDRYFWSAHNRARFMESDVGAASIVIAVCYGFRRQLLQLFPEDVIADDIYVSFLAHAQGCRVVYSRACQAVELRGPETLQDFLAHKFRKSNGFLRESLRFLYRLPDMRGISQLMFVTRVAQQLLLPWALLLWLMLGGALISLGAAPVLAGGTVFVLSCLAFTSWMFSSVELPDGSHSYSLSIVMQGWILTNVLLLATGVTYPFFRQTSSFARLPAEQPSARPLGAVRRMKIASS
jgi:biofilm PGA synthesis N-glycosyltransferase PgaC